VKLDEFNALTADEAAEVVRPCADIPAWIDEIVVARPYGDLGELIDVAQVAAEGWSDAEVDAALAQHPRIGERAQGDGAEATLSRNEQSSVSGLEAEIAAGNRAYEEKFGRIFLIRAAGRSAAEVLDQLTTRLGHDAETEAAVVADQLREIAVLRLEGMLTV
jgi:2-oxo-4-hydroxy-4-carboxy-5-ureidoimidazoline decarboxylase